jgi:hypothetical protein
MAPRAKFSADPRKPTAYEFACGAVQRRRLAPDFDVTLWREHGVYHVRAHNHGAEGGRVFWDSFRTLTEARKRFALAVKEYGAG